MSEHITDIINSSMPEPKQPKQPTTETKTAAGLNLTDKFDLPKVKTAVPSEFTEAKDMMLDPTGGATTQRAVRSFFSESQSNYRSGIANSDGAYANARKHLLTMAKKTKSAPLRDSINHFIAFSPENPATSWDNLNQYVVDEGNPMERILGGFYASKGNNWVSSRNEGVREAPLSVFQDGVFTDSLKEGSGGFTHDFLGKKSGESINSMLAEYIENFSGEDLAPLANYVGMSEKSDKKDIAAQLASHIVKNYHESGEMAKKYKGMMAAPEVPHHVGIALGAALNLGSGEITYADNQFKQNNLYAGVMDDAFGLINPRYRKGSLTHRLREARKLFEKGYYVNPAHVEKGLVNPPTIDLGTLGLAGAVNAIGHFVAKHDEEFHLIRNTKGQDVPSLGGGIPVKDLIALVEQGAIAANFHGGMGPYIAETLAGEKHIPNTEEAKKELADQVNDYVRSTSSIVHPDQYHSASWGHKQRLGVGIGYAQQAEETQADNSRSKAVLEAITNGTFGKGGERWTLDQFDRPYDAPRGSKTSYTLRDGTEVQGTKPEMARMSDVSATEDYYYQAMLRSMSKGRDQKFARQITKNWAKEQKALGMEVDPKDFEARVERNMSGLYSSGFVYEGSSKDPEGYRNRKASKAIETAQKAAADLKAKLTAHDEYLKKNPGETREQATARLAMTRKVDGFIKRLDKISGLHKSELRSAERGEEDALSMEEVESKFHNLTDSVLSDLYSAGEEANDRFMHVRTMGDKKRKSKRESTEAAYEQRISRDPKVIADQEVKGYATELSSRLKQIGEIRRRGEHAGVDQSELDKEYHTDVHHVLGMFSDFVSKMGYNPDDIFGSDETTKKAVKEVGFKRSLENVVDMVKAKKQLLQEAGDDNSISSVVKSFAKAQSGPTKKVFPSTVRYAIQKRLYGKD